MENGNVMALMRERYLARPWLDRLWRRWGNALCCQLEWLDSVLSPVLIFIAETILRTYSRTPIDHQAYAALSGRPAVSFEPFLLAMLQAWS